jgi:hypothetical protein
MLKREYLEDAKQKFLGENKPLSGDEWYMQQTVRTMN